MKFSGDGSLDKRDNHGKGQGQRLKVKVAEVKTRYIRFRAVTPVYIHERLQNDTQSSKQHRRRALLIFKVIRQISKSYD